MMDEINRLKEAQNAQQFPTAEQTLAIMELGIERAKFNMLCKIPDIIEQTKDQSGETAQKVLEHILWDETSYTRDRGDKFYDKKLGNLRIFFKDKMNAIFQESIKETLKILFNASDDTKKVNELKVLIERTAHKAAYEVLVALGN